jgi:hypothetical protein
MSHLAKALASIAPSDKRTGGYELNEQNEQSRIHWPKSPDSAEAGYELSPPTTGVASPNLCWHCGKAIDWRAGAGLAFADGAAAHVGCDDELERQLAADRRVVETMPRAGSIDNCTECRLPCQLDSEGLCETCCNIERRIAS